DLNGFYLIQDSRQMRDGKETFATHGVFTYDRDDRHYKLFWHDSLGYYSPAPASGGWTGKSLILVRGSLRGNARHVSAGALNHARTVREGNGLRDGSDAARICVLLWTNASRWSCVGSDACP